MIFSEVQSEVLRRTVRPDKGIAAEIAINKAISYCTINGEFPQDMVEATIQLSDPTAYGGTVSITTLTRFRRFSYVKPTAKRYYLTPLAPDKIFTPKGKLQPNVYYVAGTNLTYTLSEPATSLEVGYYTYPTPLDSTNQSHWLLDIMPSMIIDLAASYVFSEIGDDASARSSEASGMTQFLTLRRDLAQF